MVGVTYLDCNLKTAELIEERMELYPAMLPKSPRAPEEHESLELTSKSQARRQKHPKQSNLRFPKPS